MIKYKLHLHMLVLVGSIMTSMLTIPTVRADSGKEAIEITVEKLDRAKPELNTELATHIRTFENLILSFLSKSNTEPFRIHLEKIGKAIEALKTTTTKYNCRAAKRLRDDLDALVCTLRKHAGQTSGIKLGLDLLAHKHLLPDTVIGQSCGLLELPACLSYRLNCR